MKKLNNTINYLYALWLRVVDKQSWIEESREPNGRFTYLLDTMIGGPEYVIKFQHLRTGLQWQHTRIILHFEKE